jgi:hypothetical protein
MYDGDGDNKCLRYGSTVLDKSQGFRHTFYMLYGRNGITGNLPPGARFLGWGVVPPAAPDDLLDLQIRLRGR